MQSTVIDDKRPAAMSAAAAARGKSCDGRFIEYHNGAHWEFLPRGTSTQRFSALSIEPFTQSVGVVTNVTSSFFGAPPYKSHFMFRSLAFYCHAGMVLSPSQGVLTLSCTVLKNGRNESVARTCYGLKHDWSTSGG